MKLDVTREITIGRLPVMVKFDLCWMREAEKGDCEFDHGGYFLIKGAEKVSYNYDLFTRVSVLFVTDFVRFRVTYVFSPIKFTIVYG
jgi:DNA-directed RNA polymerase beta subunit